MDYQKTYLLTTAKLTEIDTELCPTERIELASARKVVGDIPIVPILENQKDLTKLVATLLSTGINRNDDTFLPSEILPVRNTGAHKPVNLEHDPKQIIGHMLRTFASEKDGTRVLDKQVPKGRSFDITAEAVLYSFLFPDLIRNIKERAEANNLFVSVEVWFTDFDFLVGTQLVKRNEKTASRLEPRLKVNGGNGFFEGQRLGRVLRNMIIGGIGIVKDPANPESIIKSISSFDSEIVQKIEDKSISSYIICDIDISDQKENINLNKKTEDQPMNPEILEEMAALASAIKATLDTNEESKEIEITDKDNLELMAIASRVEKLEKANKELKIKAEESEFKAQAAYRAEILRKSDVPEEMLERHLTRCFSMTKEQFDDYVDLLVNTVNLCVLKSQASSVVAEEKIEEQVEQQVEKTDVQIEEAKVDNDAVEEPVEIAAEVQQVEVSQEETVSIEDEVEIDIEAVDPAINVEGEGTTSEPSLVDQMGDIVQQFLKHQNEKWGRLSINK